MKFAFGNHAHYTASDGKTYHAVVLGPHNVPQEGHYSIAYEVAPGNVKVTHCWEERLARIEYQSMALLEIERRRAIRIAHDFMDVHAEKHKAMKAEGNRVGAFVEEEMETLCRDIANKINGGDGAAYTLGETMRDRIEKEYAMTAAQ